MKLIAVALLSLLCVSPIAVAQTAEPPHVIATGEGVVEAVPDRAWITIGVESRSKTSKDAQQRTAAAMTAVQQKLGAMGLGKDAVRTTGIDLQLEFDYADGKQTPRGYVARNTIGARVDELSRLGDVLDAVVASGATQLQGLRFDVKERSGLEQAALQAAVKNATSKAQALAAGAGRAIERVIRIEEQFVGGGPEPVMRSFAMAKVDASTPVAPGQIEIRAHVRLTAALK